MKETWKGGGGALEYFTAEQGHGSLTKPTGWGTGLKSRHLRKDYGDTGVQCPVLRHFEKKCIFCMRGNK